MDFRKMMKPRHQKFRPLPLLDPALTAAFRECTQLYQVDLPPLLEALDGLLKSPEFDLDTRSLLIRNEVKRSDEEFLAPLVKKMRLENEDEEDESLGPVARGVPKNRLLAENVEAAIPRIMEFEKLRVKLGAVGQHILREALTNEPFCPQKIMRKRIIQRLDGKCFKGTLFKTVNGLWRLQDLALRTEQRLATYHQKRAKMAEVIYTGTGLLLDSDSGAAISHMDVGMFIRIRSILCEIHGLYKSGMQIYEMLIPPQPKLLGDG